MKKINICGKEYLIDCNAFTYVQFKKKFNTGIFKDIQTIKDFLVSQTQKITLLKLQDLSDLEIEDKLSSLMLEDIDGYIDAITRLAYIFIYTANENIEGYEAFMKGISKLSIDDDWVVEVTEFAVDNFC
jgi:hypothetical protein